MISFIFIALFASFIQISIAKNGSIRKSFAPYVLESEYVAQPRLLSSTPFQCNSTSFCSDKGECSSDKTSCKCDTFYTTFPIDNAYQCNYEQKTRLTAFLLQFFICGSGQMYLGNLSHGVPQFLFTYFAIVFICFTACSCFACSKNKNSNYTAESIACSAIFTLFVIISFYAWAIADAIMIGLGQINDSNGVQTYRNM